MSIFTEYRVSPEQVDSCQRFIDEQANQVFYLVPSATTDGTFYRVNWDINHARFGCSCKAGASGQSCWHSRASVVAARLYADAIRDEQEAEARIAREEAQERNEQAERIEAANSHPYRHPEAAVEVACKRNAPRGFSLLR